MEFIPNNINFHLPKEKTKKFEVIEIDLIDACQLKCQMCLRQEYPNRKKQIIMKSDLENFKQFFTKISFLENFDIKVVRLIGVLSEPTLYPYLSELIVFINSINIAVQICTNGQKDNNDFWLGLAQVLNQNKYNELIFALEGTSQETYSKYRINGNYSRLLDNILIVSKRREFKLGIQFIKFQHNIEDEAKILKQYSKDTHIVDFIDTYHCNEPTNLKQDILPTDEIIKNFYKKRILINNALIKDDNFKINNISCKSEYFGELFIDTARNIWPCTNLYEFYYRKNLVPNFIRNITDEHFLDKNQLDKERTINFECYKSCSNFGHKLEIPFLKKRIINEIVPK